MRRPAHRVNKAGIETSRRGAHILRHSLAVHLLRSGETLKSIGDVLGHRSPDTTFIYTKLRVEELSTVALDPGWCRDHEPLLMTSGCRIRRLRHDL